MKSLYKYLSSIKLTIILTYLIVINTIIGSFILLNSSEGYSGIDHTLLVNWLLKSPTSASWWIFSLIILLFFFSLNTVFCTYDRLSSLIKAWRGKGLSKEAEELSLVSEDIEKKGVRLKTFLPYLVHIGFLIALFGHLVGSLFGFKGGEIRATTGEIVQIKESKNLAIKIGDLHMKLAKEGYPEEMSGEITLMKNRKAVKGKKIGVNSPLIYGNVAVYIKNVQPIIQGFEINVSGHGQNSTFLLSPGMSRSIDENNLHIAGGRINQRYGAMEILLLKGGQIIQRKWLAPSMPGMQGFNFNNQNMRAVKTRITNVGTFTLNKDPGALIVFSGLGLFGLSLFAHIILRKRF